MPISFLPPLHKRPDEARFRRKIIVSKTVACDTPEEISTELSYYPAEAMKHDPLRPEDGWVRSEEPIALLITRYPA